MPLSAKDILSNPRLAERFGGIIRKAMAQPSSPQADEVAKAKQKREAGGQSDLEDAFARRWEQRGGPALVRQHRFCDRRWRFDFAHLSSKVAIEIDGGTWSGGRHVRGGGHAGDAEKRNTATMMGWRVFVLTKAEVDGTDAYDMIRCAIEGKPWRAGEGV